jgi:nucleotide-binding universal stress UspA family protein
MTPRKILCPIDFSAGAQNAFRVAARLASEANVELLLVHAWFLPAFSAGGELPLPADAVQGMVDDAERGLTDLLADAKKLGVTQVSSQLVSGPPWERIIELAEPDDLIVMGTHGRTGLTRLLLGSVAEKVVRHAPCSVLVTRPDGEARPFRHLLVPVDFSEYSQRALEEAGDLASRTGARVTLMHVIELPPIFRGSPPGDLVAGLDARATTQLGEWAGLVEAKTRTTASRIVRTGSAAGQILAVLGDDPTFDLVVTGSHGRTGFQRLMLGSVAEKLVRFAARSVLVAR